MILGLDSGMFYKECEVCNLSKPSRLFRIRTDAKQHSRRPFCLSCEKVKHAKNYKCNREQRSENVKQYRNSNWQMKMLWQAKNNAARKGLPFNLEKDDILLATHCKYLGIPLTQSLGEGTVWSNTSLDRIDSSLGYIKGNVEVISRQANSMKNMATIEELRTFAKNILLIYGE